ncbi:MAG: FAD-dependent oxidoreductase [Gammaproteobacteria bacterium]|nr:MAG: FAD-dependent oxidoreductase [Gammaproteobacteria bacterium]
MPGPKGEGQDARNNLMMDKISDMTTSDLDSNNAKQLKVDVVVFGGGVAGLWLLARLLQEGYNALLLENNSLGAGQTRFSQGIIHGGTKYALTGKLTASSESIFAMPQIWRDCLQGKGEVDLSSAMVLSEHQYMWSTPGLLSRLSGFFASRVVRGRMLAVKKNDYPAVFKNKKFKGKVYRLDEPVVDAGSIIKALAKPNMNHIMHIKSMTDFSENQFNVEIPDGEVWNITVEKIILSAGKGNAALLKQMGRTIPEMQLRPLQMVMVRGGLPEKLYAHCLGASVNPRITITSSEDKQGNIVWYLGGQLAEEGIHRTAEEQIRKAKKELQSLMPWLNFSAMQWATLNISRAEQKQKEGQRPSTSFYYEENNVITTWPTKLALAPNLANDVLKQLEKQTVTKSGVTEMPEFSHASVADLPWQEEEKWQR